MTGYLKRHILSEMEELAPVFDELTVWSSRFGLLLLDHLEIRPRVRGLDLGCATGFPLIELAMLHGPGSRFTGVDLWQGAIDIARKKLEMHRLANVDLEVVDAASLPFPEETFDLITSNLGLNNFEDPAGVLREAFRVSRPGGRLVLTTNPIGTMPEVYKVIRQVLGQLAAESIPSLDQQERHRATIASTQRLLSQSGFQVTRTIPARFEMTFADGTALLHHGLCAWFLEDWRTVVAAEEEEAVFAAVERILNEQASVSGSLVTSVEMAYVEAERARGSSGGRVARRPIGRSRPPEERKVQDRK